MSDYSELKRLAEAASVESLGAPWAYEPHGDSGEYGVGILENEQGNYVEGRQGSFEMSVVFPVAPEVSSEVLAAFIAAANPSTVLALIAEVDRITTLNNSQFGDAIRRNSERDQLKAEVERLTADNAGLRGSCAKMGAEHAGMVRQIKKLKGVNP